MDELTSLLGRNGFLPHGYCFTWSPPLLWTLVLSDGLIAAAYFSIPAALLTFLQRRRDASLRGTVLLFSAFIFACGLTHLMDVWTIWNADYALQALTKVVTAAVSVVTAIYLWRLIPQALRIPTVAELRSVIERLESEVAKRRSAEEHLTDLQQNLSVTLSSIGAGFVTTDREGRVTGMNTVAEQLLGWSSEQSRGQALWDVLELDGRPQELRERNPVDLAIEQGLTVYDPRHVVVVARDGHRYELELKAALTRSEDGRVRGLALVFRDITAAMRAEIESARLAAIIDSSNDAIIGKTLEGRITSWNRAAQRLFGYSAEEAIGQPIQLIIPPERESEEVSILAQVSRGSVMPPFDTQRRTRDGRLIDVSISISPIRDARGRIVGASKIARDIAPLKEAEQSRLVAQRLEAENRQIQEANRLKSQFLANMSHELRTPLNAVIGFADLLYQGIVKSDSPKHHEYVGHIASSGRHLLQLINDVLDLAKVESGKFEFVPEPVQLPVLVKEVVDVLQAGLQRKHLALRTELAPELVELVLDPGRLKQALYNYLSNAMKFTPEGGRITVRAQPEGQTRWRLEVEDTGIGIAAADLSRLFTEFQQLDGSYSKRHAGTGLGLALTRKLIEAQGGLVGVRSKPGVGSVFHLVLDRVAGTSRTPSQRVLVVQDDVSLMARLARELANAGFEIDEAATAHQAIQRAHTERYGALTLDVQLPDMGGFDALARIREAGLDGAPSVRGLSMSAGPGQVAMFAVADVLLKPIRTDEIAVALARLRDPRPKRVMVVDDDPLALQLMQVTLSAMGITAVCLDGGQRALREIALNPPDVLILDLMMPAFDGFQTLDALRQLPAGEHLPVFVWTSMVLDADELKRLASTAAGIIDKGGGHLAPLLQSLQRWREHEGAAGGMP